MLVGVPFSIFELFPILIDCLAVVLGGDTPLALPLILGLEKKGYIVIASVSTPEAVAVLEQQCEGYVRALVLDPHEVSSYQHVYPLNLTSMTSLLRSPSSFGRLLPLYLANSPSHPLEIHSHHPQPTHTFIPSSAY